MHAWDIPRVSFILSRARLTEAQVHPCGSGAALQRASEPDDSGLDRGAGRVVRAWGGPRFRRVHGSAWGAVAAAANDDGGGGGGGGVGNDRAQPQQIVNCEGDRLC